MHQVKATNMVLSSPDLTDSSYTLVSGERMMRKLFLVIMLVGPLVMGRN